MLRRPTVASNGIDPSADICPVCKSNRYLNPSLTFLINPECYHTMCTSCVDRLFTSGPAPCPVAGCHKTLRKKNFHPPFFADLAIEREVDVRKRVGAIFNRRRDEFETLLDWNNYLEEVESLIFDIVEGSDIQRKKAEETLKAYADQYKDEIKESARTEREEAEIWKRIQEAEADGARRRRMAAVKEDADERADVAKTRRQALEALANGDGDAHLIARQAKRAILETTERRRVEMAGAGVSALKDGLVLRGLKKKEVPVAEQPYDPFDGLDLTPTRYALQDSYENEWLSAAVNDARHMVGGYSLHEYYARTMFEAFAGLGVFIENEVAERQEVKTESPLAAKAEDDVF